MSVDLCRTSKMSGANSSGFGVATAEALGEKAEMQHLNSKLADYMNRVGYIH